MRGVLGHGRDDFAGVPEARRRQKRQIGAIDCGNDAVVVQGPRGKPRVGEELAATAFEITFTESRPGVPVIVNLARATIA